MFYSSDIKWDATYDVIVVGFGGAGAVAARFAADNDAQVLLTDSAPEGSEGGNTRYSGGAFAWSNNFEELKEYYKQTYYPFRYDEKDLDSFVKNVLKLKEYSKKYFGIEAKATHRRPEGEYPEYKFASSMQSQSMTSGMYNGRFWKLLRSEVYSRLDKIDIWYDSPAMHLIQNTNDRTIFGVQIQRKGKILNIAAKNGVILSCGGFENNPNMIQDFLGQGSLAPIGTLYNRGKGIDLAIEVGARLWHMSNYDSHGLSLNEGEKREKFAYMVNWPTLFNGSIFVAGDDGTRYFREDEEDRHGYKYNHGNWIMMPIQNHPHIIMDQTQYLQLKADKSKNSQQIQQLLSYVIKANSIHDLAISINAAKLKQEVKNFDFLTNVVKRDMFLNRNIQTMRAFDNGPYYAIPVRHNILHTHGGAKRNTKCEVIDLNGGVIPHLYEAGELGDIFATKYIGANSIADLLISGKISGENAAKAKKQNVSFKLADSQVYSTLLKSDAVTHDQHFSVGNNQGIGISKKGISDTPIIVRVTVDDNKKLNNIEVLQQSETDTLGGTAIPKLVKQMISKQTSDVDAISGATTSSYAFKDAVNDALKNVRN